MPEALSVKVGTELSVEAVQNVQIERGGDAVSIVIRPHESRFVFYHICPQQQGIAGSELRPQIAQNTPSLLRREVADARTDVHRERAPTEPVQLRRVSDVVRHHWT